MAESKKRRGRDRVVTFEVKTTAPLGVGEQVFVAGNQEMLGSWRPDGFPLTRMGENTWAGTAFLPSDVAEYKVTRGSWDTEEANPDGSIPENSVIKAGGDTTIRRIVAFWADKVKKA